MAPLIFPQDRLVLAPLNGDVPGIGELIFWQTGTHRVIHRFVGEDRHGRFIEAGDAGLVFRRRNPESATARVVAILPADRAFVHFRTSDDCRHLIGWIMWLAWKRVIPKAPARLLIRSIDRRVRRHAHMKKESGKKQKGSGSSLVVQETGEELILYDPSADQVHLLNPTARFIWEGLQKGLPVADVASALAARYPELSPEQAASDVQTAAEKLRGLLRK